MYASRTALSQGQRQFQRQSRHALARVATATLRTYSTPSTSSAAAVKTYPTAKPAIPQSPPKAKVPGGPVFQATSIAWQESEVAARASEGPSVANVDWSTSFHGVASQPVTAGQFEVLMRPFAEEDIEVKPDGVIYLPEMRYRRRLNEAFGPMGWGLVPKGDAVVGDGIVTREYALVVNGRFVSQAQGENGFFGNDGLPSAVEGCKSNALMRCCKDLGIASELWDPRFVRWFKKNRMEEVWVEHATTGKKRTLWYRKGAVDVAYPYKKK